MALVPLNIRDGNGASQNQEMFQGGNAAASGLGNNIPVHSLDSTRTTYRFSASFTPQATAAVTLISIQGSATKTVRVTRILLGGASTALSVAPIIALQRTSALGAGGTTVNPTASKNDSQVVAATAVVAHYTATLKAAGTGVGGPLSTQRLFTDTVTTPTVASRAGIMLFPEYGAPIGQALVLRGTADFIEIQNVNAGNLAAGTVLEYAIELVEDAS